VDGGLSLAEPAAMDSTRTRRTGFGALAVPGLALGLAIGLSSPEAIAKVYRCQDATARILYADSPCYRARTRPYRLRGAATIEPARRTGGHWVDAEANPSRTRPLDPVRECRARGGDIDPELHGCGLP
jgi:hypothetical protein